MKFKLNSFTKAIIWITGISLSIAVEAKFAQDRAQARDIFKHECTQELKKSSDSVASKFHALYADLRTLARMPAVRNGRLDASFQATDWANIRELYASMADSTPVRLVRIVPVTGNWAGQEVDTIPLTNSRTAPLGFQKLATNSRQLHLIGGLLAKMPKTNQGWDWDDLREYPAYTCRAIWMKVPVGPKGKFTGAFVTYYSVPIYSEDGRLQGAANAEMPYPTLISMLPKGDFILSNRSVGMSIADPANKRQTGDYFFSETAPLAIQDRAGPWTLQYRVPMSSFTQHADLRSAQEFRWVAHVIVAAITIASFFVFSSLSRRRSELEEAKRSLENRVLERTTELADALHDAKDASRIKGEFLANMSHEIRTPMNGVMAMTELLLHTPLDDEQKDLAQTIISSANSLLTIINDVLDFSKIEAKKLLLERTRFNLAALFEDVVKLHAPNALEKGLEIIAQLDPSTEVAVEGDPVRIRQIASNLLGNAIKFTNSGSVILSAKISGDDRTTLKFTVKDSGVGIPPARIDAIFDSFTQSDASTTRKFGGTGLGLTISRHLAELMGGNIGVHSKLGAGSEFFVTIHLDKGPALDEMACPQTTSPKSILVCDDFEPALEVIASQLASVGHKVELCSSAGQLLERLAADEASFQVLVIDQTLGPTDGIELCRELASLERCAACRIVLVTTSPGGLAEELLRGTNIAQTLAKPVRKEALLKAVQGPAVAMAPRSAGLESALQPAALPLIASPPGAVHMEGEAPAPQAGTNSDQQEPAQAQPDAGTAPAVDPSVPWAKVLVVEDNLVNQKVAKRILMNLGCEVTLAHDGIEAIDMDLTQFDIVFMDCQMPRLDGLSATRQIRHREIRTGEHAIIVALTANAMEEDRKQCFAAGMDEYMSKPLRPRELEDLLRRLLQPRAVA